MCPLLCEALWEAPRPCRGSKGKLRPQRQELCSGLLFPSGFAKSSCLAQAPWRCWSPSSPSSGEGGHWDGASVSVMTRRHSLHLPEGWGWGQAPWREAFLSCLWNRSDCRQGGDLQPREVWYLNIHGEAYEKQRKSNGFREILWFHFHFKASWRGGGDGGGKEGGAVPGSPPPPLFYLLLT